MATDWSELVQSAGWALVVLGLIGAALPVLPGPVLIWLGALAWAWADGFQAITWGTLLLLGGLALAATAADLLLSAWGARRGGASWRAVAAGGAGAVVGLLLLGPPGALVGAVAGTVGGEALLRVRRGESSDWPAAWRSGGGLLIGWVASIIVQLAIALTMAAIFAWNAL